MGGLDKRIFLTASSRGLTSGIIVRDVSIGADLTGLERGCQTDERLGMDRVLGGTVRAVVFGGIDAIDGIEDIDGIRCMERLESSIGEQRGKEPRKSW